MTKNKKYQLTVDVEGDSSLNDAIDSVIKERVKAIARGEIDSTIHEYLSKVVDDKLSYDVDRFRTILRSEISRSVGMYMHTCDIRNSTESAVQKYLGDNLWIADLVKSEIHDRIASIDLVALASLLNLKDRE